MQTACTERPSLCVPRASYDALLAQLEVLGESIEEFEEAFGITLIPVTEH